MDWRFLATFIVGLFVAGLGVLNRAGYGRGAFIWHDVTTMPGYMRYAPYGNIPGGLAISMVAVAGEFGLRDRALEVGALMGSGFLLFGVAAWLMWKRPDWIKPEWIREREDERHPPTTHIAIPRLLYRALWAGWVVMLVVSLTIERSFRMAAPLGFGLMILLALRPASPDRTL